MGSMVVDLFVSGGAWWRLVRVRPSVRMLVDQPVAVAVYFTPQPFICWARLCHGLRAY